MATPDIFFDHPSRLEPFDPMEMPEIATVWRLAEWHKQCAAELSDSSSDLASFHQWAARCLCELHCYLLQLHSVLAEGEAS